MEINPQTYNIHSQQMFGGATKSAPTQKKHWTPCCKFAQKKGKGIGSCNLAANIFQALPGSNPQKAILKMSPFLARRIYRIKQNSLSHVLQLY